jgi:hypothetical protein
MSVEQADRLSMAPPDLALKILAPEIRDRHQAYDKPLITETRIWAAWVPEHIDVESDVKVSGHWVYFRLANSQWVVDGQDRPDDEPRPPVRGSAKAIDPSAIESSLANGDWIVPYREPDAPKAEPQRQEATNGLGE